jgi:hypothetical protein
MNCDHCGDVINPEHFTEPPWDTDILGSLCAECSMLEACDECGDLAPDLVTVSDGQDHVVRVCSPLCAKLARQDAYTSADLAELEERTRTRKATARNATEDRARRRALAWPPVTDTEELPI